MLGVSGERAESRGEGRLKRSRLLQSESASFCRRLEQSEMLRLEHRRC